MKKKLALLLSAVMVVGMIPMTAFAVTTNEISKVVTGTTDTEYATGFSTLTMKEKSLRETNEATFKLTLTGAEWLSSFSASDIVVAANAAGTATVDLLDDDGDAVPNFASVGAVDATVGTSIGGPVTTVVTAVKVGGIAVQFLTFDVYKTEAGAYFVLDGSDFKAITKGTGNQTTTVAGTFDVDYTKLSNTQMIVAVESNASDAKIESIKVNLKTVLKTEGDVNVTVDPMESVISSGTYKFANCVGGATTTTIEKKTDLPEDGAEIKSIVITETAAGSLEGSSSGYFKLKLSNGFLFKNTDISTDASALTTLTSTTSLKVSAYPSEFGTFTAYFDTDREELYIRSSAMASSTFATSQAATISVSGLVVKYDDDVKVGDIADITVSGYNMTKQTIEVGTAVTYGVSITAENKTLPTFIAGRADADVDSLKVTFKEIVADSWLNNRKTEITFPEGVKVTDVDITGEKNVSFDKTYADIVDHKSDRSVVKLSATKTGKVEAKFQFELSIDPGFTGDIVATFGGAGLEKDFDVVIGTVVAPVTVEADTNKVMIDYRNVEIGDIIIKETATGNLEKDKTLYLNIEEMQFDGTPTVEVIEGDLKIDKVKVTNKGRLEIKVKSASSKTPAVIKVTDNKLFLNRSLPAGKYALSLVISGTAAGNEYDSAKEAIFQVYDGTPKGDTGFDTDEVEVLADFIEVVTAGRDQDDSTFTTQLSVTIGADKLIVGGDKEIALDVPAYISEGYTMLPVRAITEALSGTAIVRWDDATKTVTLTFGTRVVSMTVGSKTMNINGVAVQMSKACEITDSRAFIPLRDLGYALGLNDSKINWDDETKTATLN